MELGLLKGIQTITFRVKMSILLVRHGETALNAARIVQHPDTPLNERGIGQAQRLAARLADFPIMGVVSSDYKRAHMTAEAISTVTGLPIVIQESLRERNFGDARGVPHGDLGFDLYAPDFHPPGGESWPVFHQRVLSILTIWARTTCPHLPILLVDDRQHLPRTTDGESAAPSRRFPNFSYR